MIYPTKPTYSSSGEPDSQASTEIFPTEPSSTNSPKFPASSRLQAIDITSIVAIAQPKQPLALPSPAILDVYPSTYSEIKKRERQKLNPYPFLRSIIQVALGTAFGIVFVLQSNSTSPPRQSTLATSKTQSSSATPLAHSRSTPSLPPGFANGMQIGDRSTSLPVLPPLPAQPVSVTLQKTAQSAAPIFVDRLYIPQANRNQQPQAMGVVDRFYFTNPTHPQDLVVVDRFYPTTQSGKQDSAQSKSPASSSDLPTIHVPARFSGNLADAPVPQVYALVAPTSQSGVASPTSPSQPTVSQSQVIPDNLAEAADSQALALLNRPVLAVRAASQPEASDRPAYKLLGVLELGQQSAALFQTSDNTYSTGLGESVGNSNWVVTSLSNGKAVLQRNDEMRSLSIGDSL